jgi:RNA polymerase sigma factor (sigma-70 family)
MSKQPPHLDWPLLEAVQRYACLFVPEEDAADIAQQTWERIRRYTVEQQSDFNLARVISKNLAMDWLRRAKREPFYEDIGTGIVESLPDTHGLDPFESVDLWESLYAILTQEEIQILILSYRMEMTLQEIAGLLNRPLTTIYSIRSRALSKAREALGAGQ